MDRLTLITASIPPCRRLVDVGSDHATVPITLLERGLCEQALITDIRHGPIKVARRRVEDAGFTNSCRFLLTDGLDDVEPEEGDVLLISGLGGENIAGILERSNEKLSLFKRLIFQPQTKEDVLRSTIDRLRLTILDERVAVEERRPYLILICHTSTSVSVKRLSRLQIEFGTEILERVDAMLQSYSPCLSTVKDPGMALEILSAQESIDSQDRARLVYLMSKLDKITRRARFHERDRLLLESFNEWFSSRA